MRQSGRRICFFPGTAQPQNSLQAFSASFSLLFLFSLRFLFTSSRSPVRYIQSLSSTESCESVDEVEDVEPKDVRRRSGVADWVLKSLDAWAWRSLDFGTGGADGAGEDADARSERVNNRNAESAISLINLKNLSRIYNRNSRSDTPVHTSVSTALDTGSRAGGAASYPASVVSESEIKHSPPTPSSQLFLAGFRRRSSFDNQIIYFFTATFSVF